MADKNTRSFPLLNSEEAEIIVRDLGGGLDAHGEWAGQFRTMLVCRSKPRAADLNPDSYKKTAFGRWYFGKVNPHLRDHPDFAAVGTNYENMHGLARGLAITVKDGEDIEPDDYQAFVDSVDRFKLSIRKLLSEAFEFLRFTDPLTGVMTRTAMQSRLEGERERTRRDGQPCAVGMMDLDHFKKVNDTHGHQAGDQVLQSVAQYLLEHLRDYDQVFRYGGEEFVLLLPNATVERAKRVIDRLCRGLGRLPIKIGARKKIQVTASFGVAELLPNASVKSSVGRCDEALYAAKAAGRNRVRVWQLDADAPKKRAAPKKKPAAKKKSAPPKRAAGKSK